MQKHRIHRARLLTGCLLAITGAATGGSDPLYEIRKHHLPAGGGTSDSGGSSPAYVLRGSTGQYIIGTAASPAPGSPQYTLNSGFWQRNTDLIFTHNF